MVNLTIDPAIDVTQACVRRRFRFSSCRACADVCPAQAFSLAQGQVSIDTTRCIACGDCLFVCPVDAIIGVKPVKRFVQGDTLVGPFRYRRQRSMSCFSGTVSMASALLILRWSGRRSG